MKNVSKIIYFYIDASETPVVSSTKRKENIDKNNRNEYNYSQRGKAFTNFHLTILKFLFCV